MSFAAPLSLLALLTIPALIWAYVALDHHRRTRAGRWASPELLPNMVSSPGIWARYLPAALLLIGFALLVVGFAKPQHRVNAQREGATVMLAIDVSGSMAADDVTPNRIGAARSAALEFLGELPDKYRVGLVTFSSVATVKAAPTYDHQIIAAALPDGAVEQGTALGDGVQTALNAVLRAVGTADHGTSSPGAVILLSDGKDDGDGMVSPTAASAAAKKAGVPVYTIGLGTAHGSVQQRQKGRQVKIAVPADSSTLKQIATQSGGTFFAARTADELRQVYEKLGSYGVKQRETRTITPAVVGLALLFILAGIAVSGIWLRRLA